MARGDRESRRNERRENRNDHRDVEKRLEDARQQWLNAAQSRYVRSQDGHIKIDGHNMSMAERTQKMATDRIKLVMAIEEHKIDMADKAIAAGLKGEKLGMMRKARREFASALRSAKVTIMGANRTAQRMEEWTMAMEHLVFTSRMKQNQVSKAWRGLFCIIDRLNRVTKRQVNELTYSDAELTLNNFTKPGDPEYVVPYFERSSPSLVYLLDWCKDLGLVPVDHSPLQQKLYTLMETIDLSLAEMGAAHQIATEEAKAELADLRTKNWEVNDLT